MVEISSKWPKVRSFKWTSSSQWSASHTRPVLTRPVLQASTGSASLHLSKVWNPNRRLSRKVRVKPFKPNRSNVKLLIRSNSLESSCFGNQLRRDCLEFERNTVLVFDIPWRPKIFIYKHTQCVYEQNP